MKLKCVLADLCLADYWGGHHLSRIGVFVTNETTLAELKDSILDELHRGAVAGAEYDEGDQSWHVAAEKAVIAWYLDQRQESPGTYVMFPGLKEEMGYDEDEEYVDEWPVAWFVFMPVEK